MLYVNGDDGGTLVLLRCIFAMSNSLQTPCQPETWRRSNKSKDLVDYLCQSGVKQRCFYMSTTTLTRWVVESRGQECVFGKFLFL